MPAQTSPQQRTFIDAHGVTIHFYAWRVENPRAENPRAIVQLEHGIGEYALRYQQLADRLNDAGYAVYADDHRGHGATGMEQTHGDHSKLGRLGPGGLRAVVVDVQQLTGIIAAENPGVPIVLLGHSLGSLLAQKVINRDSGSYAAAVLTGTAYRMPGSMEAGDLNKRHKHLGTTGHEWLSRDPAVPAAFAADPLTFDADILKLFGIADSLRLFGRPARRLPNDLPLLIQIGSDDSLGGEASVLRLAESYLHRSGLSDIQAIVYPGARHEVFNETNRAEVMDDLVQWLNSRFPSPGTSSPTRRL
ncbi:MAG: alpha/beta hydrolase [Microbacteriaceae bacterium]